MPVSSRALASQLVQIVMVGVDGSPVLSPIWPRWFADAYLINVISPVAEFDGIRVRSARIRATNMMELSSVQVPLR